MQFEQTVPQLAAEADVKLAAPAARLPVTRIHPTKSWRTLALGELWEYRELLFFFVWRDMKIRYRQTTLGASWAVIQPLFTMLIFSVIFGRLAKVPSDGIPYPIFSYIALVPWTFFASGVNKGSTSLVGNAALIKKVYLPRLLVPMGSVLSGLLDFAVALALSFGLMAYYRITPTVNAVWVPAFLLLALISALGISLWLGALNAKYRDVTHIVPFLIQLWLFATPVVYPTSLLPEHWRKLYALNPMVGVIDGFRWALLGANTGPGVITLISAVVGIALLIGGAFYFRHMEKTFADFV